MTLPGLLTWFLRGWRATPRAAPLPATQDAGEPLLRQQREQQEYQPQQTADREAQQTQRYRFPTVQPPLLHSPAITKLTQFAAPTPFTTAAAVHSGQSHLPQKHYHFQHTGKRSQPEQPGTEVTKPNEGEVRPAGHLAALGAKPAGAGKPRLVRTQEADHVVPTALQGRQHDRVALGGVRAAASDPRRGREAQQRFAIMPISQVASQGGRGGTSWHVAQQSGQRGSGSSESGHGPSSSAVAAAAAVAGPAAGPACCGLLPMGPVSRPWVSSPGRRTAGSSSPHPSTVPPQQRLARLGGGRAGSSPPAGIAPALSSSLGMYGIGDPHPQPSLGSGSSTRGPALGRQQCSALPDGGTGAWPGGWGAPEGMSAAAVAAASVTPFDPRNPRRVVHISRDGTPSIVKVDRHQLVAEMGIAYRDLRAIDPALPIPTPTAILIRERALVVNLESVRMIVGSDQVYVLSVQHPVHGDGRMPGGYGSGDIHGMYGGTAAGGGTAAAATSGGGAAMAGGVVVDCVCSHPLRCPFIGALCTRLSAATDPTCSQGAESAAVAAAERTAADGERRPPPHDRGGTGGGTAGGGGLGGPSRPQPPSIPVVPADLMSPGASAGGRDTVTGSPPVEAAAAMLLLTGAGGSPFQTGAADLPHVVSGPLPGGQVEGKPGTSLTRAGSSFPSGPLSGGSAKHRPQPHAQQHHHRRSPHFFSFHRRPHGNGGGSGGAGGGSIGRSMQMQRQSTLQRRRSVALAAAWEAEQARRDGAAASAASEEATVHGGGSEGGYPGNVGAGQQVPSGGNGGGVPAMPAGRGSTGGGDGDVQSAVHDPLPVPVPGGSRSPPSGSSLSLLPPQPPPQPPQRLIQTTTTGSPGGRVGGSEAAAGAGLLTPIYPPPPPAVSQVPAHIATTVGDVANAMRLNEDRGRGGGGGGRGGRRLTCARTRAMDNDAAMLDLELPYELRALETALFEAVRLLDLQVQWLEVHVPRTADDMARGVSPAKLERVREAKRAIKVVGARCRRLSAALRGILDDDDDMLDMYLGRRAELEGEVPEAWHLPPELRQPASTDDSDGTDGDGGEGGGGSGGGGAAAAGLSVGGRSSSGGGATTYMYGKRVGGSGSPHPGVGSGSASSPPDAGEVLGDPPDIEAPKPQSGSGGLRPPGRPTSAPQPPQALPHLQMRPMPHVPAAHATGVTQPRPAASALGTPSDAPQGQMAAGGAGPTALSSADRHAAGPHHRQLHHHHSHSHQHHHQWAADDGDGRPRLDVAAAAERAASLHRQRDGDRRPTGAFAPPSLAASSAASAVSACSNGSEAGSSRSRSRSSSSSSRSRGRGSLATTDWAGQLAGGGGPRASPHDVEDCENLLEFYYVQAEALLGRLDALTERIDDTEDLVNIDLDNRRNQIVGIDLVVTSITLMFTFVTSVAGIFGMNMRNTMEDSVVAFYVTTVASFMGGLLMCAAFLGYVVQRRLLMLPANGGGNGSAAGDGWGSSGGGVGWGGTAGPRVGWGSSGIEAWQGGGDGTWLLSGNGWQGAAEDQGMWGWYGKDKAI